ncbi:MAG: GAF domain-containing protein [Planctomycetota bacterium]
MKIKSIKTKLSLAVGICSFVTLAIVVISLGIESRKHALESAKEYTKESASEYAANIKSQIEVGLDAARTLAQVLSSVKDPESPLEVGRDTVNNMLKTILKENELFASAFCIWEPNSFDQMDSAYAGLKGHDNTGRFIPYWTRNTKGGFILQPACGYEVQGPSNDYLTPKRTFTEYVSELHNERIAGEDVTLISLVAPIMHDGHFHGVVGVDIPLDSVQKIVGQEKLQGSDMQINVISYTGKILASSGGSELIGSPMKQIHDDWRQDLGYIQKGIAIIEEDEERFAAFSPIHIGNSSRPWSVNINTPYETIVTEANYHMWITMLLGACLATVSVLIIYLLVSKIIRPLLALTTIAENISKGNLECEQISTGDDEIGQVNSSFEQVIKAFREVTTVCEAVSEGDFSQTVEIRSEHDVLGKSINQMSKTLQAVVRQANAIADGDYSTEIVPTSEADQLGVALSSMTVKLRETIEENERENWLKTGLGELNETIRGEQDAVNLAQNIIAKLADYLNASVGAIYLREDDDTLRMIGSYAYSKRKHISNDFKLGQGLVGQAALEKKSILVTEVPDDYTAIRSGLGEAHPRNLLVQPFLYENKLTGVIELGSFDKLSDLQLAFLEKASESIAIAIDSALSRTRMAELLEETQRQSEQLQNQQEELRATNEELEQQTEKLKKSEEILKTQQEELESSNSELEEKTVALEEQKQELENSWNQIKGKSKELELASKYKSEFLSNVSHELRTPLNSMLILARMLADNEQGNLSEDQIESAKVILEGGTELLSLINEILDLSKVEAGKMDIDIEQVELSELIEDLTKNFEHVASDKGLEFTVGISDEAPPAIRSDKKRVKQVLKNFLSNAFKFTEKGSVTLNITRPGVGVDLSASGLRTDNSIAISVTDTGIGIDKNKQETVLEAFQQADGTTCKPLCQSARRRNAT